MTKKEASGKLYELNSDLYEYLCGSGLLKKFFHGAQRNEEGWELFDAIHDFKETVEANRQAIDAIAEALDEKE